MGNMSKIDKDLTIGVVGHSASYKFILIFDLL